SGHNRNRIDSPIHRRTKSQDNITNSTQSP
ncbi:unnamed protein product, partial [Rotaria socialis]